MPSKNTIREYAPDSYYHVYNRGVNRRKIFVDNEDYAVFLSILKRHLGIEVANDRYGRAYENYQGRLELLAFCLMPNHFHLLLYQHGDAVAITNLVRSICTAYSMYFNRKNKRIGHLFQDRFRASRVDKDNYLKHISRYIHLNPKYFELYEWSSLPYYTGQRKADWILPGRILELFKPGSYLVFVRVYKGYKAMLDEVKYELADY